ncbi:MAG: hypothetical protein JXR68_11855 [Bacteroidales bacterium]|nr:hypothetical protein [Bacteroidales bacterium]
MKKFLSTILLLLTTYVAFSQQDIQLAMEYFNAKEYDKAEVLFEKLYNQRNAIFYFDYYIDCLIYQEKFDLAERKIEKQIKRNPTDFSFRVSLGYLYRKQGKDADADKEFKNIYKDLPLTTQQIFSVGNSLTNKKEFDWAEKIFKKGEDEFPGTFLQSLANVYAHQRKNELMIQTYLDYAKDDVSKRSTVQNVFLNYLKYDVNDEFATILERTLLMRIQSAGNSSQNYEEILIWFYLQRNNFLSAFIYAKSLDKRNSENGVRVYKVGQAAQENDDLAAANKAYTYVMSKGQQLPYYNKSKFALLTVMYQQVENREITDTVEIAEIENQYLDVIKQLSISNTTVSLIVDLAHIQGFYLNKENDAIELLKQAITIRDLSDNFKSKFLLELGDVYLHANMPWDAVLTYGKIEQDFSSLQITDDAKFRKAKTYFYLGQFTWAKDQWEVLKGSPSKLIANDAIFWSNFIEENTGNDSTYAAIKMYARADFSYYTANFPQTILIADSIIQIHSADPVVPVAYHLKYEVYMQLKEYENAAISLQKIIDNYSYAMWADKAVFELAQLYDIQLSNPDKAAEYYKKILFDFKGSFYTDQSRKRYRELTGV